LGAKKALIPANLSLSQLQHSAKLSSKVSRDPPRG
jgi:hypothetical protein